MITVVQTSDNPNIIINDIEHFIDTKNRQALFIDLNTRSYEIGHGGYSNGDKHYTNIILESVKWNDEKDRLDHVAFEHEIFIEGHWNIFESHSKNQLYFLLTSGEELSRILNNKKLKKDISYTKNILDIIGD